LALYSDRDRRNFSANMRKINVKDAHNKAAEHHEFAARSHRAAAGSWTDGSIRLSPMEGEEACFVANTTPSVSSISPRLIGLLSCRRGAAFNRQHPFVDVLLSDNIESGEPLDTSQQVRKAPPGSFQRMAR
jgi:hypothetical protein